MTIYNISEKVVLDANLEIGELYGTVEWKEETDYLKDFTYVIIEEVVNGSHYVASSGSTKLLITNEMISHLYGERIGEDSLSWTSDGDVITIDCLICGTTEYIYSDNCEEDLEKIQLGSNPFNNIMWENGNGEMLKCNCQRQPDYEKINGMNVFNLELQLENEHFKNEYEEVRITENIKELKEKYEDENKGVYVTYYDSLSEFGDICGIESDENVLQEIKENCERNGKITEFTINELNEGFLIIDETGSTMFEVFTKESVIEGNIKI